MALLTPYLSSISFEGRTQVRSLTAVTRESKAAAWSGTQNLSWHIEVPVGAGGINIPTAHKKDGTAYEWGTIDNATNISTIIIGLSTESFDYTTDSPNLSSFSLSAITYDSGGTQTGLGVSAIDILEFPQWDVSFRLNYESSKDTTALYRLTATDAYTVTAFDTSDGFTESGYNRHALFAFPDRDIRRVDYSSVYTPSNPGYSLKNLTASTPSVCAVRVEFSVQKTTTPTWGPFIKRLEMSACFVPSFLSANFIVFPERVVTSATTSVAVTSATYTSVSRGVSAYGEGHIETFTLSASPQPVGTQYIWSLDTLVPTQSASTSNVTTVAVSSVPNSEYDIPILLGLFNSYLPTTMVSAHSGDSGQVEYYPNFIISEGPHYHVGTINKSAYFDNIRMLKYPNPLITIGGGPSGILIKDTGTFSMASSGAVTSSDVIATGTHTRSWLVSTVAWTDTVTGDTLTYTLTSGDGREVGSITPERANVIHVLAQGTAEQMISAYPYDWLPVSGDVVNSNTYTFVVTGVPAIKLFLFNNTVLTGVPVDVDDVTYDPLNVFRQVKYDYTTGTYTTSTTSGFTATFAKPLNYSVSVTATDLQGGKHTEEFTDLIRVQKEYDQYNPTVVRSFGSHTLNPPFSKPSLGANEWVTANNINTLIYKFEKNLEYMEQYSRMYCPPPAEYVGWLGSTDKYRVQWDWYATAALGTTPVTWAETRKGGVYQKQWADSDNSFSDFSKWQVNVKNLDENYSNLDYFIHCAKFPDITDLKIRGNRIYTTTTARLFILDTDLNASEISQRRYSTLGENFANLKAIDLDSANRIFVLEKDRCKVYALTYNEVTDEWTQEYAWGGVGGRASNSKFLRPNDLFVDDDDNIWITDSGNRCVKKYSNSGSWLATFTCDSEMGAEEPISASIDSNNDLHILMPTKVIKLTDKGELITTYGIQNDNNASTPVKITQNYDRLGFNYIAFNDKVMKFAIDGSFGGYIRSTPISDTTRITGVHQDHHRNVYVIGSDKIIKYVDTLRIKEAKQDYSKFYWPSESLYINKEEYTQDWVYNKAFCRLWDNMEIFRRSIHKKFDLVEVQPGVSALDTSALSVSSILPLPHQKDQIVIGVNELVTADVINRVAGQLWENQRVLEMMISENPSQSFKYEFGFGWRWKDSKVNGKNPLVWIETKNNNMIPTKWFEAINRKE